MHINALRPGAAAPERSGADAAVARASAKASGVAASAPSPASAAAEPMRAGLRAIDDGLNARVAGAQQALNFLDELGTRLQSLKGALSSRLSDAGAAAPDERLEGQLRDFAASWERRREATGSSLDAQLALGAPGESRQGFRVRGLDRQALAAGERETLHFAVGTRRDLTVLIDPEVAPHTALRRLDRALMPVGVRVARDGWGELRFDANEAAWPDIRDSFAVKGGGHRFPAGQFHRVAAEADPDAIRPRTWRVDAPGGLRQALQEIVAAIELVRRSRATVVEVLADVRSRFADGPVVDSLWASAFVEDFGALAQRTGFSVHAAIAPALIAVSRHRVLSLLSLPPGAE